MHEKRSHVVNSLGFAFRSLIEQVRLFVTILLAGTGIIVLVVGILAFLNKGFIQAIISSTIWKDYQECVGYNCAAVAYESGAFIRNLLSSHLFSLLITGVILGLFFVGLDLGFKRIALDIHDRKSSTLGSLFSYFTVAPKAIICWILYCIMVWIGWLFFILPGFIALLRFAFFPYIIIDRNVGPIAALKMSYAITKNHVWDLFALWVVIKIIVNLGFVTWIGVILTWPLSTLAYAYYYRHLENEYHEHEHNHLTTIKDVV